MLREKKLVVMPRGVNWNLKILMNTELTITDQYLYCNQSLMCRQDKRSKINDCGVKVPLPKTRKKKNGNLITPRSRLHQFHSALQNADYSIQYKTLL